MIHAWIEKTQVDYSYVGAILNDYYTLMSSINDLFPHFIRRSANQIAHPLDRISGSQSDTRSWGVVPPHCILNYLGGFELTL